MTVSTMDYQEILRTVHQWPAPTRVALIQDLLNTLAVVEGAVPQNIVERSKPRTLQRALGLLDTGGNPPSDAEVDNWLAEHRVDKYGS